MAKKCECCGQTIKAAKSAPKARGSKTKFIWPAPVYIATYRDGTEARMSFAAPVGKPIDLRAAHDQAARHLPVKTYGNPSYPLGIPTGEFVKMDSFAVEHDGVSL